MNQPAPQRKLPLTACIICFNEEDRIEACLASVSFCERIVVVDSHSSDRTREIAATYTDRIYVQDWQGHIAQKNIALDHAPTDWVFSIDADERITPELRAEIEALFATGEPSLNGYEVPRRTFYLGRFIDHGGFYPDRKLRLFRRSKGRWGGVNPHDHVQLEGKPGRLRGDLHHYSFRDVRAHLQTIEYFTRIAAEEKLKRRPKRLGIAFQLAFAPPWKFFKMFILQRGFLDGVAGLIVAWMGSYYVMLKYARLWEAAIVQGRQASGGEVQYGRKGEA